ncbi:MAG: hypothetical protein ABI947_08365 [Chloroflexota bacterium]
MSVAADWDNEAQTTIYMAFVGKWNWDEFHMATTQTSSMIRSAICTIDLIVDFSQSGPLPSNALSNFGSSLKLKNKNVGMVVGVTKAQFLQTLSNIFRAVYPKVELYVVSSLEEAHALIANRRNAPGA